MESKLSMQHQISSGGEEKSTKIHAPRRKSVVRLYGLFTGILFKKKLAKSPIGTVRAQLRVDPKHMELQSELHDD